MKAQLTPGFSRSRGRVRAAGVRRSRHVVRRCRVVCGFPVRSAPDRPMGRYCHEVTRAIVPGPRTTPACGAAPARSPRAVAMWDRRCPGADPLHLSRRRIATALNTVDRDKSLRPSAPATRGAAHTPACSVRRARSVRDVCDRGWRSGRAGNCRELIRKPRGCARSHLLIKARSTVPGLPVSG